MTRKCRAFFGRLLPIIRNNTPPKRQEVFRSVKKCIDKKSKVLLRFVKICEEMQTKKVL